MRHLGLLADTPSLRAALSAVRAELAVPDEFPPDVRAEAAAPASAAPVGTDLTDVPFVTIDPPGSMDLDQAVHLARSGDGYAVRYAIADVAAFVRPGGAVDAEAHRRGQTFYGPDIRTPLHPTELSESAASLLPGEVRPALVWDIHVDADGDVAGEPALRRATVRSRARLSYAEVQHDLEADAADEVFVLLSELGRLREERERARGGVSLPIPEQVIVAEDGGFRLEYRSPLPVEGWNAQISLLAGMAAAQMMRAAGVGVLRTLPPADPAELTRLRRTASALGIDWPDHLPYAELIPTLDPARPPHAAFLDAATVALRGAGYAAFDGRAPKEASHAALAADYAHVTAPLRRLVDRYGLEICASITADTPVPGWVLEALDALPGEMADSDQRAGAYQGACLSLMEAATLSPYVGQDFTGVVVAVGKDGRGDLVVREPAVQGRVTGSGLPLGGEITARLVEASIERRRIMFTQVQPGSAS